MDAVGAVGNREEEILGSGQCQYDFSVQPERPAADY